MIKHICILLFLFYCCQFVYTQQSISGIIIDEEMLLLENATVKLFNKKDSLVRTVSSNNEGVFLIKDVLQEKYILAISMVGRETVYKKLSVGSKNIENLEIILPFTDNVLSEAQITTKRKELKIPKLRYESKWSEMRSEADSRIQRDELGNPIKLKNEIFRHRYYENAKYAGRWQWQSIKGDTVFTVLIKNDYIEVRPPMGSPGFKESRQDRYQRDLLVGWYELRVNDSVLFTNLDVRPKITSFAKFNDTQQKCLIGVFTQPDNGERTIHMTLRKNPLEGTPRGFLMFTLLNDDYTLAFWNLWVMTKNTYAYSLVQKPLSGDFVFPTRVIMRKIANG